MVPRDVLAYGLMTPQNQQNYMQNRANVGQWIGGSQQSTQNYLNNGLQQHAGSIQRQPYGPAVGGNANLTNQLKGQQGTAMAQNGGPQPQASQQPQMGTGGFRPQIQTGITVGPVLPQGVVQSEQNRLRNFQAPVPGGQQDYSPFMGHLQSLVGGQMNNAATDYGRDAAYANAQQQLATEQARANAGQGWGNIALGQYTSQVGDQSRLLNMILSMLGGLGGTA
jgi:hypothetical protein